jgi:DNA-binding transcriptional LysR family regulator
MQHDDLEIYVSVVEKGSFAAAARHLGLTRSAVSRRIDGLEHRLGVRLLDRTTKHLSMTDAGDVYYARGSKVLTDLRDANLAVSEFGAEPRGTLRVTSAVMIGLYKIIPHLPEFLQAHADLRIHLDLSDTPDDPNLEDHDVAIAWGRLPDSALVASKLGATRQIICATPGYIAEFGRPATPKDLHDHNCIVISSFGDDRNKWYFETEEGIEAVKVHGNFTVNSGNGAYQALLAGVGIGRVTDLRGGEEFRDGRLEILLDEFECKDDVPINALFRANKITPPKVREFIDFLKTKLSD